MERLFYPEDIQQFLTISPLVRNSGDSHWPTTLTLAKLLQDSGEDIVLQRRFYFYKTEEEQDARDRIGNLVYFKWNGQPWWCFGPGTEEAFAKYIVTRIKEEQEVLTLTHYEEKDLELHAFGHSDINRLPHLTVWKEQCSAYCQQQVLSRTLPTPKEHAGNKIRL